MDIVILDPMGNKTRLSFKQFYNLLTIILRLYTNNFNFGKTYNLIFPYKKKKNVFRYKKY